MTQIYKRILNIPNMKTSIHEKFYPAIKKRLEKGKTAFGKHIS